MSDRLFIPDADIREAAVTTFDRNVVVIAGAGTGKTTLLVNRLVHLLMREPRPLDLARIVALTFTNKAATEMKVRLRGRLLALANPDSADGPAEPGAVRAQDLRDRYGLSSERIAGRAQAALETLEKAQIGTVHSFTAHLLRLYPLESSVVPDFREDDGLRFHEHFETQWELWIDQELGPSGRDHARWRRLLAAVGLTELQALARAFCNELVVLDDLPAQLQSSCLPAPIREWMEKKRARAAELLAASGGGKPRKLELLLTAAHDLYSRLLENGAKGLGAGERTGLANLIEGDIGSPPAGWTAEAFGEARELIAAARRLLKVDSTLIADMVCILVPLVRSVRLGFLEQGWVSFDGLLAKARDLLRDHPHIREQLKGDYQAVLVDEFQDTDPVQYEIILYLAECAGRSGATWQEVDLEPGKLFIVGDPKQSIYAFRRADIEAFQRVLGKIQGAGGAPYELSTNFRSHPAVLEVVNAVFDRLFLPHADRQPPNIRLAALPGRQGGLQRPGVELRLVRSSEADEFDSAAATRAEAEALAKWIKEELLEEERLRDAQGLQTLRPGHVAMLFRTLTQAHEYLDALRRYGISYITDGEKHFYRRQEVIDLVNLLRVVEDPHDAVALVGLLRSPIGAVTDGELVELAERGALDFRRADRLTGWDSPHAHRLGFLYERLTELNRSAPCHALPDAIDAVFSRLPLLELAAASRHGEQAVANLLKVRQLAADLADRPYLSLTGFVELMMLRLSEQPDESESALAEESPEAVRVLTIHKAKGLEFPVVVLPGLHQGTSAGSQFPMVSSDWTTGLLGVALRDCWSLGGVIVHEKLTGRQDAEQRRILYVGMTRARERLVLSGGLTRQRSGESFLTLLEEAGSCTLGHNNALQIGAASIRQTTILTSDRAPTRRRPARRELRAIDGTAEHIRCWEQRDHAWSIARATPSRLTPSQLMAMEQRATAETGKIRESLSLLIGTLAHQILEGWDFLGEEADLAGWVTTVCRNSIPADRKADAAEIEAELQVMMKTFAASAPYHELRRATILGREIPFAIPWPEPLTPHPSRLTPPCIMEGQIDLVYRHEGKTWIMDYKTDRVSGDALAAHTLRYRTQARIYREAVARCLHLDSVGVQFMFLRNGLAVPVD